MTYVLVVGNVIDGFRLIGPFTGPDDASDYASDHFPDVHWDVISLEKPFEQLPGR